MSESYNISFPQGTGSFGETPSPGMKRTRSPFMGCFGFVGAIILLFLIVMAGIFFIYPAMTPDKIRGNLLDFTIVPQKDGSSRIWVLTDGSFNFIQTTKSPGSYSSGRKCYFCKTWLYVIDPNDMKVIKKTKTEFDDIITTTNLVYSNDKVYQITYGYGKNEPKIVVCNAETGDKILDSKDFVEKYSELSSGLADLHYDKKENILRITTKDGRNDVTYSLENETMYPSYSKYRENLENDSTKGTAFVMASENSSGPRKVLYLVRGTKGTLRNNLSSLDSYVSNESTLEFFVKGATAEKMSNKIFLEGIIYHQDNDCAVIIHVSQIGKKADRIMTCIDNTGKEKWSVTQEQLFNKMKVDEEKDSFSSIFFTKDKIGVNRSGNLIVLKLDGEGIMGFDYNSGKKLFTLDI